MGTESAKDVPGGLERLRRRFEGWRRTRKRGDRIPEPLWAAAVKVATQYGIHRTAKSLRLDYYALKKRVGGATAGTAGTLPEAAAGGKFLELPAAAWASGGECTLELEDVDGAKLRVHWKGFEAPDLAALSRSFWQSES